MKHEELAKEARKAIRKLHADTSVELSTTLETLKDMKDEIDQLIEAVQSYLEMAE